LHLVWVRPAPVRRPHAYKETRTNVRLHEARRTGIRPVLKDGALVRDLL
jgi:hypothetical protein